MSNKQVENAQKVLEAVTVIIFSDDTNVSIKKISKLSGLPFSTVYRLITAKRQQQNNNKD